MRTATKTCCVLAFVSMLCFVGGSSWAMPEEQYFLQDNFLLTYGEQGNPTSAGTTVETFGSINRLVYWDVFQVAAWFSLEGTANSAGTVDGDIATMSIDTGQFTITSGMNGTGTVLWTGYTRSFCIQAHIDGSPFAASYPRPDYEDQPTSYASVGRAVFVRNGGIWMDSLLILDWFGIYNTNYDADMTLATGDLQGRLIVPEPGSMASALSGLVGLIVLAVRRRRG